MRRARIAGAVAGLLTGALPLAAQEQQPAAPSPDRIQVQPAPQTGQPSGNGGANQPLVVETPGQSGQAYPQIMTIDQEGLFMGSAWGQRVQADLEQRGRQVAAENDRLASQFAAEEQELTNLRGALSPEEFRQRADEFDKRVVEVRRERDAVTRDLQSGADAERAAFFRAALPVLAQLMQERGAVVVLDQRAIFVSAQSADVTQIMIERLNTEIGAGPEKAEPAPTGETPAPAAP
ncbi:OmpH family outer membrane protein [Paracoccus laeviglucosivorans]|uniref:Periplasmic chaperone for outer membrane proteins Skp n=1 Tax=Paracoccus laeviglucosivorans TaxID=1197861 RepID=A0A521BY14_9RHOB|nr:OmpH family outer membrane protein [Paracoccus laeviglucosivorans]SMO52066.1 periplasmic chaperone for outer membrane proteins Skp [Paracoccus laeviglucosivorans]